MNTELIREGAEETDRSVTESPLSKTKHIHDCCESKLPITLFSGLTASEIISEES